MKIIIKEDELEMFVGERAVHLVTENAFEHSVFMTLSSEQMQQVVDAWNEHKEN